MTLGDYILAGLTVASAAIGGWHVGSRQGLESASAFVEYQREQDRQGAAEAAKDITEMKFSDDPAYDACQKILWLAEEYSREMWAMEDRVDAMEHDPDRF